MQTRRYRALAAATVLLSAVACERRPDPLDGRAYVPVIPREELDGTWVLPLRDPTLLQLIFGSRRAVGPAVLGLRSSLHCEVNQALAELLLECEHAYKVDGQFQEACNWIADGEPDRQIVKVTYSIPDGTFRAAQFSAYRHLTAGDIALVGTCGMGDTFVLLKQSTPAR